MTTDNTPAMPVTSELLDEWQEDIEYIYDQDRPKFGPRMLYLLAVARAALAMRDALAESRFLSMAITGNYTIPKSVHTASQQLDEALQGTQAVQADQDQAGDKGDD